MRVLRIKLNVQPVQLPDINTRDVTSYQFEVVVIVIELCGVTLVDIYNTDAERFSLDRKWTVSLLCLSYSPILH